MSYIGASPTNTAFVTDTFSGNGSTTAFTTSVAPASTSSILVSITGVLQDPSTYSVSGTTLTFSAAPPSGTGNISVRYLGIPAAGVATTAYRTVTEFTATSGQTTFSTPSYTVGFIDVYRNGVRLGSGDFTATSGTSVVLASGATTGDLITTESFYVSSVLNAIPNTAGSVGQSNLAAGVAGNGPAFAAYIGSGATISNNTNTKAAFNTKIFDTASCFDNVTNYRFTPNVAGYYQVGLVCMLYSYSAAAGITYVAVRKNGSIYAMSSAINAIAAQENGPWVCPLVYMNGTTDYLEGWVYQNSGGNASLDYGQSYSHFSASFVRAA